MLVVVPDGTRCLEGALAVMVVDQLEGAAGGRDRASRWLGDDQGRCGMAALASDTFISLPGA
jgi:hypothetical protein